tara:strand:+ start:380441 stop:381064 length:624 start_codon:yes stop_codon:yes gene_type:complete
MDDLLSQAIGNLDGLHKVKEIELRIRQLTLAELATLKGPEISFLLNYIRDGSSRGNIMEKFIQAKLGFEKTPNGTDGDLIDPDTGLIYEIKFSNGENDKAHSWKQVRQDEDVDVHIFVAHDQVKAQFVPFCMDRQQLDSHIRRHKPSKTHKTSEAMKTLSMPLKNEEEWFRAYCDLEMAEIINGIEVRGRSRDMADLAQVDLFADEV